MSIEATILGGPHDGRVVALRDGVTELRVAVRPVSAGEPLSEASPYRCVVMPLRSTPEGFVLVWPRGAS